MKIIGIGDIFELYGINQDLIFYYIKEEWIHPYDPQTPLFDEEDLARIQLIRELQEDFQVNDEGLSIILNLVDQLNRVNLEIKKMSYES